MRVCVRSFVRSFVCACVHMKLWLVNRFVRVMWQGVEELEFDKRGGGGGRGVADM